MRSMYPSSKLPKETGLLASSRTCMSVVFCSFEMLLGRVLSRQWNIRHKLSTRLSPVPLLSASGYRRIAMTAGANIDVVSAPCEVLQHTEDSYDGIIIDSVNLPEDAASFSQRLLHSLQSWTDRKKRGIWLKVPLSHVQLVEPAVKTAGFIPHHADAEHIMLIKWLPATPCTLPPSASHQVGIGAFVVNQRQEVLVVQERNGPLKGKGVWKMPTGLIHDGEDITIGAVREVEEETGIRTKFQSILAMRQAHGFGTQGKSDLFIVIGMTPDDGQEDATPVAQESEVEAVKWMPLQEYLDQPFMKGVTLYDTLRDRCAAYARGQYKGWQAAKLEAGFTRKRQDLLLWGGDDSDNLN